MFTGTELIIVIGLALFAIVAAILFSRFSAASEETMREIRDRDESAAAPRPVKPPQRSKRRR
jgi:hypothetical protein